MVKLIKRIIKFFDKLEDKVRAKLSRRPIIYTLIGAFAIVLFWKGVWDTADFFPFLTGPVLIIVSVTTLLITGLFVSFFVGDVILISGLKKEKKLAEKTEAEVETERDILKELDKDIHRIESEVHEIKKRKKRKKSKKTT